MSDYHDHNIGQIFTRDERDFLSLAAQRTEEVGDGADGFAHRVGDIVRTIRTDQLGPAVVHGRLTLLLNWMGYDPVFTEQLYDYFREGVLGPV